MEYSKVGRGGAILPFLVAAIIPKFLVEFRSRDDRYDYSFFRGSSGAQTWRIMHEICLKTNSQLGSTERNQTRSARFVTRTRFIENGLTGAKVFLHSKYMNTRMRVVES